MDEPGHLALILQAVFGLALGLVAVHASDRSLTLSSIRVTLIAIAAAAPLVCVPVARVSSGYVPAGVYSVLALGAAAAFLHLVQTVAAVAGRGRPAPLRGAAPIVRAVIAAVVLSFFVHRITTVFVTFGLTTVGPLLGSLAVVGGAAIMAAAGIASGRRGGGSILVPFAFALTLFAVDGRSARLGDTLTALSVFIGAPLVVLAGARAAGIGRRELDLLGVTAWGPGDIALAPSAAAVGLLVVYESSELARGAGPSIVGRSSVPILVPLVLAGLFVLGLRYLRGRIALAELARAKGARAEAGAGAGGAGAGG